MEPGLIGGEINAILARHKKKNNLPIQYKIGPDPSSIDSCMVGGIVSNNSSGMCCGVSQNTYHTLKDMRMVFVDGTVLDTADPASREAFLKVCKVAGVTDACSKEKLMCYYWGGTGVVKWTSIAPSILMAVQAVCRFLPFGLLSD